LICSNEQFTLFGLLGIIDFVNDDAIKYAILLLLGCEEMKLIADCHCHTLASGHAYSTIRECAEEASVRGLELIAITDHGPAMPGGPHPFYFHNLKVIPDSLYAVEILKGMEANIVDYDGKLDIIDMDPAELDIIIASHHLPCLRSSTREDNTRALIGAMANKYVNIIGHPDDGRVPLDYDELVRAAAHSGVLLELNNSSLRPTAFRLNARENYVKLLELCVKHQVSIIVNSDAHVHTDIGESREVMALLKEWAFPKELVVNTHMDKLKKKLRLGKR
jgi:putative hydrolase